MAASYFLLLPRLSVFAAITQAFDSNPVGSNVPYSALGTDEVVDEDNPDAEHGDATTALIGGEAAGSDAEELLETRIQATLPSLTTKEKIELAKPLFKRYMIPLFFVYLAGTPFPPCRGDEYRADATLRARRVYDQLGRCADVVVRSADQAECSGARPGHQEFARLLPVSHVRATHKNCL